MYLRGSLEHGHHIGKKKVMLAEFSRNLKESRDVWQE